MDANAFLKSTSFSISEDVKIKEEPFDLKKIETLTNVNVETIEFIQSETLEGLLEASATSDTTSDPDYSSHQPLNEAGLITAGNSVLQSAMGSNVNNALGIQSQSLDSLSTAAEIVPPIEGVEEQPQYVSATQQLMIEAQTTISSALIGIANNADKAEGSQKISAPVQLEIGGNSVYLVSETMIHTTTPVMSVTAEVITNQAKTVQTTADLYSETLKNKYSNIEGTKTEIVADKITTVIGRDISVASEVNQTSLSKHTVNTDVMEAYTQSLIELRSVKSTRITANENIVNQAGNISITASPGSKKTKGKLETPALINSETVNADGSKNFSATNAQGEKVQFTNVKSEGPKWKDSGAQLEGVAENKNPAKATRAKGNITIIADGQGAESGSLTIVNNSQLTSSKEGQVNLAKDINNLAENSVKTTGRNINSEADVLASMSSGRNVQISTGSTMILMTGGQTFQGLRKSDINKVTKLGDIGGPINLLEIPKLPRLPSGITTEGLKSCLKKGKVGGLQEEVEGVIDQVEEDAEAIIAAGRTILGLDNEEEPNFDDVKLNKKPKKKLPVDSPTAQEAGRREKSHAKPTGKDPIKVGGSLDETEADPSSVKLPKRGPLSETTSPTSQSDTPNLNEIISAAGVIEGGTDIFTEDEEDDEDILDETKPENIIGSGDEMTPDESGDIQEEVSNLVIGAIEEYDYDTYIELATKFTTETPGYHIVNDETLPVTGILLFAEDYYKQIIKYLKRKYTKPPYSEDLKWGTVLAFNKNTEEYDLEIDEEDYFNEYYKNLGKDWIEYFENQLLSIAAIGGALNFARNAVKFVKNNVNISDNLDDLKSGNKERVLRGLGKSLSPKLGGDYFTDAANVIKQSKFLQGLYTNVSGTLDPYIRDSNGKIKLDNNGNPILNPNNNTPGFVNALDVSGVQRLLTTATDVIGTENIQISQDLVTGLNKIKTLDVFIREGYTNEIKEEVIKVIKESTGVTDQQARDFYFSTEDRLKLLISGDFKEATANLVLDEVLSAIIGPANTQAIKDLARLYTSSKQLILDGIATGKEAYTTGKQLYDTAGNVIDSGKDLYTSLKATPSIIAMMNYYEVPTLNQVNTLITCLDLKNNVKEIIQGIKNISNTVNKLEELGGDLFNIIGRFSSNFDEGAFIAKERVDSLVRKTDGEPQTTPRIIQTGSNSNLLSQEDIMSELTNGLVSGGIVANNQRSYNDPSEYIGNTSNVPNNKPQQLTNFEKELKENYLQSQKSVSTEVCFEPYNAFAENNESINPGDWENKVSDSELLKIVETLPRLSQMYNSILELPAGETIEGLTKEQVIDIKNTKINIKLDPCFVQVKLNAVEANIEIIELKKGMLLFKMEQSELLNLNNKDLTPGINTLIQLYAEEFYDINKRRALRVERNSEFYTPVTYNFKVVNYQLDNNLGLAQLIPTQSRIYLRSADDNLVYNYNIIDIGNKLEPQVLDAYVVL